MRMSDFTTYDAAENMGKVYIVNSETTHSTRYNGSIAMRTSGAFVCIQPSPEGFPRRGDKWTAPFENYDLVLTPVQFELVDATTKIHQEFT